MTHRRHASAERLATSHRTTRLHRDAAASQRVQVKLRNMLHRAKDLVEQIPWAVISPSRSATSHARRLVGVVIEATNEQLLLALRSAEAVLCRHEAAVDALRRDLGAEEGDVVLRARARHNEGEDGMLEPHAVRVAVAASRRPRVMSVDERATAVDREAPLALVLALRALVSVNEKALQRESDERRRRHRLKSANEKTACVPRRLAGQERLRSPHHHH